jgi:hypothetical protein
MARHEAGAGQLGEKTADQSEDARRLRRLKVRVVAAIQSEMISLPQALERFNISVEELVQWERDVGADVARRLRAGRGVHVPYKRRKRIRQ